MERNAGKRFIPLSVPNFEGNEKKYAVEAIAQGWVSTGGSYVAKFEQRLADYLRVESTCACQSGTAALHLSLIEAGVKENDVVLVPSLTFIASVNPVKYQSGIPVFIDCDDSLCMDPSKLESFCKEACSWDGKQLMFQGSPVRAVMVVHVFGNMADMESIMDTAKKYGLRVIEDAAEALGTRYLSGRYRGKYAGTIGDFGAYSFNGNKIITTGGGGAVTANCADRVEHIRFLASQAKTDPDFYIHDEIGYNYRMTNLQAALGTAQLEELPGFINRKRKNYDLYRRLWKGFAYAELLPFREGTDSNRWFYSLCLDRDKIKTPMHKIIGKLRDRGIQVRAVWGLIHEQKPYQKAYAYRLEKAPYYADRILNIPCSTQITEDEIAYTAAGIAEVLEELADEP